MSQKIIPFLWFDKEAEEAMNFYISVFNGSSNKTKESKVVSIQRYEEGMNTPGMPEMLGKVITAVFELNGQRFMCLDGGPIFKFNEAVSLYVDCQDQDEVDYFWEAFTKDGGEESVCGWLKDKYGLSWQIVPKQLDEMATDPNRKKALAAINAMLKQKKIVIADIQKAFDEA